MRRAMLLILLALPACSGGGASPDDQLSIAFNSGTNADVCAAARRAADQAMQSGNQALFRMKINERDLFCDAASRDPNGRPARQQH